MNTKLSRFAQMMIAVTFAEAGEFETSRNFTEKEGDSHEQQSWIPEISDGKLEAAS